MFQRNKHYLILAVALLAATSVQAIAQEAELLDVLRSDATLHEKSAACRQLARVGTKEAVPTLATLLEDEKLSHMARYALEPIQDPSVDEALRDALGKVQGRHRLGIIGSLGVRRDAKAVKPLAQLLADPQAGQAAARALGDIGTPEAAAALQEALPGATGASQLAICEGLLRCAEQLAADGNSGASGPIYDRLRALEDAPAQVRTAALRGAILSRGEDGVPLLVEAIHDPDYVLAAAAVRTAMESPSPAIGDALVAELPKVPEDRRGLVIMALADRGDSRALPAVLEAARSTDTQLRLLSFRALKRIGDASCVPALLDAATGDDDEVAQAAVESLESLQGQSVDQQLVEQLSDAQGKERLVLIDLAGRRRIAAAAPALWQAAEDTSAEVRIAAVTSLGAVLDAAELPRLLSRLPETDDPQEAAALDKALREVCLRSADREGTAAQVAAMLPKADTPVQSRLLDTLNLIGGQTALRTVAAATQAENQELRDAAYRVLGQWKSADAAPVLLELHNSERDNRFKIRAIRGYIRIARQFDMPALRRAEMCRTALEVAERDADKRLVLEVLLRYPNEEMQAIAEEAAKVPALKEQAQLVLMGITSEGIDRAELGRALAQAGHTPVELEIIKAEYGAEDQVKDVTETLRQYAKNYRIIFLPSARYNEVFGDPAQGIAKQLKIRYRINGKEGEVSLNENSLIVLPMPQ